MVDENILSYIKDSLSKGYSKEAIREILLKEGYNIQEIDEAINGLSFGSTSDNNTNLEENLKLGFEKKKELKSVIEEKMPELQHQQTTINQKFQQIEQEKNSQPNQLSQNNNNNNNNNNNTETNELNNDNNKINSNSELNSKNNHDFEIPKGKLGEYDKDKRPSRQILHLSLKNLSDKLNTHSKILVIGAITLLVLIMILVSVVMYMFIELKTSYNEQTRLAPKADVAICGYCEYFTEGGCQKYYCCANSDCDDGSSDTVDRCILPSSKDARCSNTLIDSLISPKSETKITETENNVKDIQTALDDNLVDSNNYDNQSEISTDSSNTLSGKSCESNIECDDDDSSTKDMCLGSPNKVCLNLKITSCIPGDNYCPESCTIESDTDCS